MHLTLSTTAGTDIEIRTYISSPVGITPDRAADSCLFLPVPYELRYSEAEKSGLETIASAKNDISRTTSVMTDVHALEKAITDVLDMLDRVGLYVAGVIGALNEAEDDPSTTSPAVIQAKSPATTAIGKFLLNTLSVAPKVSVEEVERMFNTHVQDVLLVSYLANTIRTQIDLGNRLAGVNFPATEEGAEGKEGEKEGGEGGEGSSGRGRGGRGRGGRGRGRGNRRDMIDF